MNYFKLYTIFLCLSCVKHVVIECQDFVKAIEKSAALVAKYRNDESIPGTVIGVHYRGRPVWIQAYGYSDIENDVKCDIDTVVRTGSVTKAMVAALVAKLVEQSKIVWDNNIHDYLPTSVFPIKQWKGEPVNITVRQLMSMTGGIRSTEELRDFRQLHDYHNVTETLAYFASDQLVAKPGTKFFYSNWGWHVIGALMESVTGQDFEVLMNSLFAEFGMNSTRLSRQELVIHKRAEQYSRVRSNDDQSKHWTLRSARMTQDLGRPLPWLPMGGVITSVPDLLVFTDVMLKSYSSSSDGYLKPQTVRQLWTPGLGHYGMGWFVGNYTQPSVNIAEKLYQYIHYSGLVAGSVTTIALIPELNISAAMVANMGGIDLDATVLSVINQFVAAITL
ncbi:serine beta-lactamase-like protein LACTB, mitochondrial [Oppia nitens]|uniref:serine beta-lactamase-like protein LACTB, mitochondrial n=1 Tax=Oppia nitens TaxID=1686743 RepID=UPI0023DC1919|nr:serine beta-lactamase-like protein LACTB, mitochondrial [Oppia nitens]